MVSAYIEHVYTTLCMFEISGSMETHTIRDVHVKHGNICFVMLFDIAFIYT
jgi:hypothetical protein